MVLHNRLWFYIMDYVKSIISEIIPGLWTLWTNYEHYEVPEPLMAGFNIFNDNKISITPLNNIVEGNNKKIYISKFYRKKYIF